MPMINNDNKSQLNNTETTSLAISTLLVPFLFISHYYFHNEIYINIYQFLLILSLLIVMGIHGIIYVLLGIIHKSSLVGETTKEIENLRDSLGKLTTSLGKSRGSLYRNIYNLLVEVVVFSYLCIHGYYITAIMSASIATAIILSREYLLLWSNKLLKCLK